MEAYTVNQAGNAYMETAYSGIAACADDRSVATLMANLEEQVKRAHGIAARTEQFGAQIFGPRPQSVGDNTKPSANSLESLIANLAMALTEAEMNLNRL